VKTDDGVLDLVLTPPRALGGNGTPGTNPEQLFAAGYSACFGSAIVHIARAQKIQTGPLQVTDNVAIGPIGQAFGLAVELVVELPEMARERAEALVRAAHEVCPYSNATRGNIEVALRLA
jgi:Ohr subfamily peroxiredoxin